MWRQTLRQGADGEGDLGVTVDGTKLNRVFSSQPTDKISQRVTSKDSNPYLSLDGLETVQASFSQDLQGRLPPELQW